jgi:hypothetical protein
MVAPNKNWRPMYDLLDVEPPLRRLTCQTSRNTPDSALPKAPTTNNLAFHVALADRVAALHHQRHGRWPKIKNFLLNNRLTRLVKLYRMAK